MTGKFRGSLALLALHVLSGGESHGYAIAQRIKGTSAGVLDFKEGTLYPALHDMEGRGLVRSVRKEVGGRPRRVYSLTPAGRLALASEKEGWATYVTAVQAVLVAA